MNEAWAWRPLGEVTIPTSQWHPRTDGRSSIRYIDVSGVDRDELSIVSISEHSAANAPSRARKIVHQDDTIFATVRPTLRRIAQVPECLNGEIVSTAFCVLRPNPELMHPDFLFFAMQLECLMDEVAAIQTGASYPAVRDVDVMRLKVPVPPLSDQYDIVDALNLARSAILGQKRCNEATQALKQAAMHTLFTGGLQGEMQKETEIGSLPESWDVSPLGKHFFVATGGTPSRRTPELWEDGTIPWVKTTEINYNIIQGTEEYITQVGLEQSSAKMLPVGTLLLAMYGQGVTRGKVAILGIEATCNQACAAIQSQDLAVDDKYLYHFLTYRYDSIRQLAHGGQQQNLNLQIIRDCPIAIPSIVEQREIIVILDAIDHKIDYHQSKRVVLEELFKALLYKIMTGEIRVGALELAIQDNFT